MPSIIRITMLSALGFALALTPSLLRSGGDAAQARTTKQCSDKFRACNNRCEQRAAEKYPKDTTKQIEYFASCGARTCNKQNANCLAAASDGKKNQPLKPQKVTRSPATSPRQPLTQQKVTRASGTAPTQPLTQQKTTGSAGGHPMQPLAVPPSVRRSAR